MHDAEKSGKRRGRGVGDFLQIVGVLDSLDSREIWLLTGDLCPDQSFSEPPPDLITKPIAETKARAMPPMIRAIDQEPRSPSVPITIKSIAAASKIMAAGNIFGEFVFMSSSRDFCNWQLEYYALYRSRHLKTHKDQDTYDF